MLGYHLHGTGSEYAAAAFEYSNLSPLERATLASARLALARLAMRWKDRNTELRLQLKARYQ